LLVFLLARGRAYRFDFSAEYFHRCGRTADKAGLNPIHQFCRYRPSAEHATRDIFPAEF
jgi:hypothetical protein